LLLLWLLLLLRLVMVMVVVTYMWHLLEHGMLQVQLL